VPGFDLPPPWRSTEAGNIYVADEYNNAVEQIMPHRRELRHRCGGNYRAGADAVLHLHCFRQQHNPVGADPGAAGLDFVEVANPSCITNGTGYAYSAGDTCTVFVELRAEVRRAALWGGGAGPMQAE